MSVGTMPAPRAALWSKEGRTLLAAEWATSQWLDMFSTQHDTSRKELEYGTRQLNAVQARRSRLSRACDTNDVFRSMATEDASALDGSDLVTDNVAVTCQAFLHGS